MSQLWLVRMRVVYFGEGGDNQEHKLLAAGLTNIRKFYVTQQNSLFQIEQQYFKTRIIPADITFTTKEILLGEPGKETTQLTPDELKINLQQQHKAMQQLEEANHRADVWKIAFFALLLISITTTTIWILLNN